MTAAVLSLTERIAELATRWANDPQPHIEIEARALLAGNWRALGAWADFGNALGVLDDIAVGHNLGEILVPWAELHVEAAEAQATAHWLREKADAFDELVMAASLNPRTTEQEPAA